ncbi:MAG TPA: NADH:flavin oxidoreductase [Acidobacteriota bacterium]
MASLKSAAEFRRHISTLPIPMEFDDAVETGPSAPLAQPFPWLSENVPSRNWIGRQIGNRFCVLPMEGWDGAADGKPSELTLRRWRRFGQSGAKLIWGGEAVAVRPDGRANPNQLVFLEQNKSSIASLRATLLEEHKARFGTTDDLLVGLQLTHSGRFSCPNVKKRREPLILYHHPILDARVGISPDYPCMTDAEIAVLVEDFTTAARHAADIGFDFVDIKHCHGYLGHEFLSSVNRPGRYGGCFENRTRFLREVVSRIRSEAPSLEIGVRLSAFDMLPFRMGEEGHGVPESYTGLYPYAFGADPSDPLQVDLEEAIRFLKLLQDLDIRLVCITAGSPYYTPHIQRPAIFPPSDGYLPPEDPLLGVARQISITAQLKNSFPQMTFVGSGYSYLQEWLPHVAQYNVRNGNVDFVGLGRLILPYPDFAADVLAGTPLRTKSICRTFSDCTTGPRNGLVSGCFPLDPFYKSLPDAEVLRQRKRAKAQAGK